MQQKLSTSKMIPKAKILTNYPLKKLTTMKIGGPAKYFFIAKKENDLISAINWAKDSKIKWYIIGDGSNLVPSDSGFNGLVIKNEIKNFEKNGNRFFVGAGNNLLTFIYKLNQFGWAGMEKMAGIPGTIGGAIYGSAGAYSQEIKDCLTKVKIYNGKETQWLSKKQCRFGYRESIFKNPEGKPPASYGAGKKDWIILGAEFKFKKGDPKELQKTSKEIIKMREKKYWPGLLCPGSFFKNIVINNVRPALRQKFLSKIDKSKVNHGKVPTGYLLEEVGAKGMKVGRIKVAKHHGNLIFNPGKGKSSEIIKLAKILKQKVKNKFGINLDEEIQYI